MEKWHAIILDPKSSKYINGACIDYLSFILFVQNIFPQECFSFGVTEHQVVVVVDRKETGSVFVDFLHVLKVGWVYVDVLYLTLSFVVVREQEWDVVLKVNDCVVLKNVVEISSAHFYVFGHSIVLLLDGSWLWLAWLKE